MQMRITNQFIHRFLLSLPIGVAICGHWVGKNCSSLTFTFMCSSCFPSLPKTMIGCNSSLRHLDSIIYTVQLECHGIVHDTSLGES